MITDGLAAIVYLALFLAFLGQLAWTLIKKFRRK